MIESFSPEAQAFYAKRYDMALDAIESAKMSGVTGPHLQMVFELEMKAAAGALWEFIEKENSPHQPEPAQRPQPLPIRRRTAADATSEQERRLLAALDSVDERIRLEKSSTRAAVKSLA